MDLRVATIRAYDGTVTLVPNAGIYRAHSTNLSRRGRRRTAIHVGIDDRDDQERARQLLLDAVAGLEEVLEDPEPTSFLTGLGDPSVDFEVRVWFDVTTHGVPIMQDLCYRAGKAALDAGGFTIPWPIRTLAADMQPLEVSSRPLPPAAR